MSILTGEAGALLRQAPLLARRLGRRLPGREAEQGDVIVLLHGIFATAGVFAPLEGRIAEARKRHRGVESRAFPVASFSYAPTRSFPSLVDELDACLAELPRSSRIHLVGHSLGGILARWYVQEIGDSRVVETVSLASPFHGTRFATRFPGVLARELSPGSPRLLTVTDLDKIDRARVPHTSFVAAADRVVQPPESAAFPRGETVTVPGIGHNGILFHGPTLDHVTSLLVGPAPSPATVDSLSNDRGR
jgi:triacylglycerol lipase